MKLSEIFGTGATVIIKNVNIINSESGDGLPAVVNPGIEYGEDDKAKWSPPLQQELSVMKSVAGVTPDADTTVLDQQTMDKAKQEQPQPADPVDLIKKLVAIFGK